jgi:hypothetical protein
MSLLQAGFGSSGEYTIDDSLRFRSSACLFGSDSCECDNPQNLDMEWMG